MKYDIISFNTKRTLAESLKKAMHKKPLSKVTVSEIIADCGVNRKTFYYHFENIYALLKWMLNQEALEVVRQLNLLEDYREAILFVMDYIDANSDMLKNICHSLGSDVLKQVLYGDFFNIVRALVDGTEEKEQLCVSQDYKNFLCSFYTEGIAGILLDWIEKKTFHDRERVIEYVSITFYSSIAGALRTAAGKSSGSLKQPEPQAGPQQ